MHKLLFAAALAASTILGSAAYADDDVVIGAGLALSGIYASYGTDIKAGADLATKEINAAGGVLGRNVRVDYSDTGGDRSKSVAVYQQYAATPEVVFSFVLGSPEFVAINPLTEQAGLPFISVGSVIPFKDFAPCVFRTNLILNNAIGAVLTQLKGMGKKRVAIMYDVGNNNTVAEADIVKENLEKYGLELADIESYKSGDQNFTVHLERIRQSNADLIWVSTIIDEGALIINQARSILGEEVDIIGGSGLNDERLGELSSGAAKGVMSFALFNPNAPSPLVAKFVENFKADNGGASPSAYNALGYDAIGLITNAVKNAGSTDRAAVCKAYASQTYEGVNGSFTYNGPGDNQKQTPQLLVFGDNGYQPLVQK